MAKYQLAKSKNITEHQIPSFSSYTDEVNS